MFTFRSLVQPSAGENARTDHPRRVVDSTVTVEYGGKQHLCVLRDISPKGAGLVIGTDLKLPNTFELKIDGRTVTARVAWRKRNRIGVRLGSERLSPAGALIARFRS